MIEIICSDVDDVVRRKGNLISYCLNCDYKRGQSVGAFKSHSVDSAS